MCLHTSSFTYEDGEIDSQYDVTAERLHRLLITGCGLSVLADPTGKGQPETDHLLSQYGFHHCAWHKNKYVHNLATVGQTLCELLKSKSEWIWGTAQQKGFLQIKKLLTTSPTLVYFDVSSRRRQAAMG